MTVTASTTIPTSIMKMFGYANLPLQVTCYAKQDFVNTDILLVLDNTGSMNDDVNNNAVNGGPTSKIVGLRNAVMALYDQLASVQTQLESVGLRLRYGIVPYSSTVNVGSLVTAVNASYVKDSTPYQTRVANYTTPVYAPSGTKTVTNETYSSNTAVTNCLKYGYNQSFSGYTPNPAGEPIAGTPTLTYYLPYSWNGSTTITDSTSTTTRACVRTKTVYSSYTTRYAFTDFSYQQDSIDTSGYKTGTATRIAVRDGNSIISGSIGTSGQYDGVYIAANATDAFVIPTAVSGGVLQVPAQVAGTTTTVNTLPSTTTYAWTNSGSGNGTCIEERKTVSTITSSSGYSIPGGAYDLDIDAIPTTDDTRWAPHWPEMIWYRKGGSYTSSDYDNTQMVNQRDASLGYYACPTQAMRLKAWTRADLLAYVNSLKVIGGTYHDIGMIWGARFLSPSGIFGSDNPTTYGNMPVSKYIIFLTDGLMAPNPDSYTAYGVEYMDQRVTGTASATNQKTDHIQRLAMICNAAKAKGVSIWVIGFAQALDSSLTSCASSAAQASTSASQSDLIARFTEIGKNIGALRLTQ